MPVGLVEDTAPDGPPPAELARIDRRAARMQHRLDAAGYRTLAHIGGDEHDPATFAGAPVLAEIDGPLVRGIDPTSRRVLWHRRFLTPRPHPPDPGTSHHVWRAPRPR